MSVVGLLLSEDVLREYREHYLSRHAQEGKSQAFVAYFDSPRFQKQLSGLIDGSWTFSVPEKKRISVKRSCFVYPADEALLMGFLNYVLQQVVAEALPDVYSRAGAGGTRFIVKRHLAAASTPGSVVLKGDVKSFSDTIRRDVFLRVQGQLLADDPQALDLVKRIYESGSYFEDGEQKSTSFHLFMGTPLDSYSNNTVLYEMDRVCRERSLSYARFYDDFALVLDSRDAACEALSEIQQICDSLQLRLHPQKTRIVEPQESYEFLGLKITGDEITLSQSVLDGIWKSQIPLFRQLVRMVRREQVNGAFAMAQAIQYIREWSESDFFKRSIVPLLLCLSTDADLRRLDHAIVDWLRAIGAGTTSNAKYRITYEQIQALGYKSLVGLYYSSRRR